MIRVIFIILILSPAISLAAPFDINLREQQLNTPEYSAIKQACLAKNIELKDNPKPIEGLYKTADYGSDRSANDFSWYVMVLSGRALAGDKESSKRLINLILKWAQEGALLGSDNSHDTYYAIKRIMFPTITAYSIIKTNLSDKEDLTIFNWIDAVVRPLDKKFDGEVDENNHRYLADSVLMLWGYVIDDKELYNKGIERFKIAVKQMRKDGSLPLEARRGARAMWYLRQSLANLGMIAEIARLKGDDLYSVSHNDKTYSSLLKFFTSAIEAPAILLPYSAENYIPGPSNNFLQQDMGFLQKRGNRRHYMGFAEVITQRAIEGAKDLRNLVKEISDMRPFIDEFAGGNATCFWGEPQL